MQSSKPVTVAALLMTCGAALLAGQEKPKQPLRFEVASIKPHVTERPTVVIYFNQPGVAAAPVRRFSDHLTTVKTLIQRAYGLLPYQVLNVPDWAAPAMGNDPYFDVDAVAPMEKPTPDEMRAMLQSLLADRFRLTSHTETKELSVYQLQVAKRGFHLKPADPMKRESLSLFGLIGLLSPYVDRVITDHTGLTGAFEPPPDALTQLREERPDSVAAVSAYLVQRFGLELKPAKERVEVRVIDHVERPTPN